MASDAPEEFTEKDRADLERLLSNPVAIPKKFRRWLIAYLEAHPPAFLYTDLVGVPTAKPVIALDKSDTPVEILDSTTETAILSTVVPGNTLGDSGVLRVGISGDLLNNSGAGRTHILRIKFGGVTFYADTTASLVNSATRRAWEIEARVANVASDGIQFMSGEYRVGAAAAATTGVGDLATTDSIISTFCTDGTLTVDTSVDQTLEVTIEHSIGTATQSYKRQHYLVEVVR